MVKGYPAFWYNGKNHIGSRFMYECYNGPITKDLIICHTCDNLKCVNPNHLWEDTTQQNTLDRDLKNRTAKGSKISTSKLKEVDVFNILNNIYLNKYKNTNDILLEYNMISLAQLNRILNGISWKYLTTEICNNLKCELSMLKNKIIDIEGRNSSILNNNNVLEICKLINLGHTYKSISEKFNISIAIISNIKNGKIWKHITGINIQCNGSLKGESHKSSKLTEKDVLDIRKRLNAGEPGSLLAVEYRVGNMTISRIRNRQTWKHI
jgi:hypothetical protein